VRFVDLQAQQERIKGGLLGRLHRVLDHGQYIMGPEVEELEERLASYVGVGHAVGCSSGTDALLMALMAHGVGPGDAVLTTAFTFVATAEVIALLGATPVFVDIDPCTFNISADALSLAVEALREGKPALHPLPLPARGGRRMVPRGIVAVDLFGLPADYGRIQAVAEAGGLFTIEDGAQSFGAEYRGRRSGSLGRIGCTSFYPSKPLGCYGDGGMCFTDDEGLALSLRSLRLHGDGGRPYESVRIGINGRLDSLQAAVLLAKLEIFEEELAMRQEVAERYGSLLAGSSGLVTPRVPPGSKSAWALYSVLARDEDHRSLLRRRLSEEGIPSAVYYPRPLHLQPAFSHLGYEEGDFPVSESVSRRILSLPMHPYLRPEEQERIAAVLSAP
jgi:UDP-2-acetamido-2-deoxy-ribo-hexuluronate aminotransferase